MAADRSARLGTCTLRATKVTLPVAPNVFEYAEFSIENVSKEFPEGVYQISAFEKTNSVRYKNGFWLSAA
jgi:hypothetical protein